MPTFRSKPITTKSEKRQLIQGFPSLSIEMQGWRSNMEDATVMGTLDSSTRYYAVLDGHGGEEVARFSREHLFRSLQNLSSPPSPEQITEAFIQTDLSLQTHREALLNCSRNPKKKRSSCFSGQMLEMRRDHRLIVIIGSSEQSSLRVTSS